MPFLLRSRGIFELDAQFVLALAQLQDCVVQKRPPQRNPEERKRREASQASSSWRSCLRCWRRADRESIASWQLRRRCCPWLHRTTSASIAPGAVAWASSICACSRSLEIVILQRTGCARTVTLPRTMPRQRPRPGRPAPETIAWSILCTTLPYIWKSPCPDQPRLLRPRAAFRCPSSGRT